MSDIKTMVEKSMAQTDTAIAFATKLTAICDTLIAEKEKLAAHNAMLRLALTDMRSGWRYIREAAGDLYGVGWDRCEQSATTALNATQVDADVWKAKAYVLAVESGSVALNAKQFDHFEECMTKLTTTASGMVTAAAQMLEFSKQSRSL